MTKVLILGATGMLGYTLFIELGRETSLNVTGAVRNAGPLVGHLSAKQMQDIAVGTDARDLTSVRRLLDRVNPDIVINCVGVIKQAPGVVDVANTIAINSLLPHLLARECAARGARLIQISTDCVFSGVKGNYAEDDEPDARDLYGRSKSLGEPNTGSALTMRTSIIGNELLHHRSLVDWFLRQVGTVNGYTNAIYSGVTTRELARVFTEVVFPLADMVGLYHVASEPISKYELLRLIAREYDWPGRIVPCADFTCDRSLNGEALFEATGYRAPPWPEMVRQMRLAAVDSGLVR